MRVKVNKNIDSASLNRIVKPGEVVDLPIELDSVLIARGLVTPTDEPLTEGPPESDEGKPMSFTSLLTDNDNEEE